MVDPLGIDKTKKNKNMSKSALATVSTLCISSLLGAPTPPSEPFQVAVPCWSNDLKLQHCDAPIPASFRPNSDIVQRFKVCHAGVLAVQDSQDKKVIDKLLLDGSPNVFFCPSTNKKFLVLTRQGKRWSRDHLLEFPEELVGQRARFFVKHEGQ